MRLVVLWRSVKKSLSIFALALMVTFLLVYLSGARVYGPYIYALVASILCAGLYIDPIYWRIKSIDPRIRAILTVTAFSISVTLTIYALGYGHDPATLFGAIFAGWIASLAFFGLIGIAVAIVSLEKPEDAPFEARARALFRRKTGPHIEYIMGKLANVFEHFAERTENKTTILEFCEDTKKYRIQWTSKSTVRSYLDDVQTTHTSRVKYLDVTSAPAGKTPNRLVHVRIGTNLVLSMENFTENGIDKAFDVPLSVDKSALVETCVEAWIDIGELNSHEPARFTQSLEFAIDNQLSGYDAVPVEFRVGETGPWDTFDLQRSSLRTIYEGMELKPPDTVYEYKLKGPK